MNREQIEKSIARIKHDIESTITAIDRANDDNDYYHAEELNQELIELYDHLSERENRLFILNEKENH